MMDNSPAHRLSNAGLAEARAMAQAEEHAVALVPSVDDTLQAQAAASDYAARLAIAESLAELDAGRARAYAESLEY